MQKLCEYEIIKETLNKLQDYLMGKKEIFLSEADFKFSFAQQLNEVLKECEKEPFKIILEYPILTNKLYENACDNCKKEIKNRYNCKNFEERFLADRTFIDLFFEHQGTKYFIEFKYKLKEIKGDIERHGEKGFKIKSQLANNIARHQVYEDIERMENILRCKENCECKSFVIFITNDDNYWGIDTKNNKNRTDFHFQLKKGEDTSCCTDEGLVYNSKKNSRRRLYIKNKYSLDWKPYLNNCNSEFQILVIECKQ